MIHYYLTNSEDVFGAALVLGIVGIIFGFTAVLALVGEFRNQRSISAADRRLLRFALGILIFGIFSLIVSPAVILMALVGVPPVIKKLFNTFWFAIKVSLSDVTSADDEDGA